MSEPAKAEHTPGPWISDGAVLFDGENTVIASNWQSSLDIETDEANLQLCSASPDLLAACESVMEHWRVVNGTFTEDEWTTSFGDMVRKSADAIAKAKGLTS